MRKLVYVGIVNEAERAFDYGVDVSCECTGYDLCNAGTDIDGIEAPSGITIFVLSGLTVFGWKSLGALQNERLRSIKKSFDVFF